MQEPYGEGVATHSGPESCDWLRKETGEALTGVRTGWVLSLESSTPRAPTPSYWAEGNTGGAAIARHALGPARSETPRTYGNSLHGNREIPSSTGNDGEGRDCAVGESSWSRVPRDGKCGEDDPQRTAQKPSPLGPRWEPKGAIQR